MTSFEPVDRRDLARQARHFSVSSGRSSDGDPLGDPAPEILDLGGGASASSGFDRRAAVVIAVVAALVTFGFAGRVSGPAAAPVPSSTAEAVAVVAATTPPARPALELIEPSAGTATGGPVAVFVLRADRPFGTVEVTLATGQHVLGTTMVKIAAAGPFKASIPVGLLPFAVDATLRVTPARSVAEPLFAVQVRLEPPSSVILSAVRLEPIGTSALHPQVAIEGFASAGVDELHVAIASDRADPITTAQASFSGSAIGWGGMLLGGRPFSASLDAGGLRPGLPVLLVLTWSDAASGATTSIERVLVPPTRSPDTIAPDGTHLPWTPAED